MLKENVFNKDSYFIADFINENHEDVDSLLESISEENRESAKILISLKDEIETFANAYKECALWSSVDDDSTPLDASYTIGDFNQESEYKILADCISFMLQSYDIMKETNADYSQHGHDFWLTRNGHGAGFWDRGYREAGEKLSNIARGFGESYINVGNDSMLDYS